MNKIVKVNATWKGGMQVDAETAKHAVTVDQPEGMGGKDLGANPMEYQLFALGGCLGTIAAIVAKQERIELRGFSVQMAGEFDSDYLLGKTPEGRAGFTEIDVSVNIDADLTQAEKQAFFERVDSRCPISDNLINGSKVVFDVEA
ncbi:MAG: OsmC family protein [Chloroflexota bacterium]|nr:OsmC family protein [Chloroflexota bacterium]